MNQKRLNEIKERKEAILTEIDAADEARMAELETELDELEKEERELQKKLDLRSRLGKTEPKPDGREENTAEARAKEFAKTNHTSVNTRALLLSGGTIAQPTGVAGEINEQHEVQVSSLIDMITVTDCTGMGTYRVPYEKNGLTANAKEEGKAATESEMEFGYIDLTPNAFNVLSYVSKQIKKQTPLMYESKVTKAARTALRKKASKLTVDAIYAQAVDGGMCATKELAIDATTLRNIAFAYGGEEGIAGGVLILNKKDLVAFGDVRGTNEKKAVYEITPDAGNENTGIIKDGGLSVRYVINSNCNALSDKPAAGTKTMIYGNPKYAEMGTWGDIDISTSEDYKFAEGLLSVLGETLLDVDVVVKNGFLVATAKA